MQLRFFPHLQAIIIRSSSTPFVIFIHGIWDTKGRHGPVCLSQPGYGSEKSVCSIKICFFKRGTQPNITVVFEGTERGIVYFDKQAYKNDVIFY